MSAGRTEFELKFSASPADVAGLVHGAFIASVAAKGGHWERLSSTYYDTPDRLLAAQRLSLRLREEAGGLVQAVKARGHTITERTEYETEITHHAAFPAETGEHAIDKLIGTLEPALAPVAGTTVDRWAAVVRHRGAELELTIDLGRAECRDEAGRAFTAPLAEVELELISGEPAHVFAFAQLLAKNAPLRYCALSKLDKAQRLSAPQGVIPPAPRTQIDPEMPATQTLQCSLNDTAARIAEVLPFILDLRAPEGIHQMRVALRRLRSIERVFRPYLKGEGLSSLAQRAKGFARALGPARDWDVFIGETLPVAGDAPGFQELKANAEMLRAQAWADAASTLASKDFAGFVIDIAEAGTLAGWRKKAKRRIKEPARDFAPAALDRALDRTIEVATHTPVGARPADRHPLRIALKKLRYPVQLFRPIYSKEKRKAYMSTLSSLQDAFGAVNDAAVAQRLADLAASGAGSAAVHAAGFIAGYKAAEAQKAAATIDANWAAFEKMTPFWRT